MAPPTQSAWGCLSFKVAVRPAMTTSNSGARRRVALHAARRILCDAPREEVHFGKGSPGRFAPSRTRPGLSVVRYCYRDAAEAASTESRQSRHQYGSLMVNFKNRGMRPSSRDGWKTDLGSCVRTHAGIADVAPVTCCWEPRCATLAADALAPGERWKDAALQLATLGVDHVRTRRHDVRLARGG